MSFEKAYRIGEGFSLFGPTGPTEPGGTDGEAARMENFVRRIADAVGIMQLPDGSQWECWNNLGRVEWRAVRGE